MAPAPSRSLPVVLLALCFALSCTAALPAPQAADSGAHDSGEAVPDAGVDAGVSGLVFPSCQELSARWVDRYHGALHAQWPVRPLDCDGASIDRAFAEAAYVLEHTRFRTAGLDAAAYPAPPADMLAFVSDKYVGLTIEPTAAWPSTDVAARVLHFYPAVAEENGFQVVGNLIHEARHADGDRFLHVACTEGPNAGQSVCDDGLTETFAEGGCHPIAMLYFAWVAARSNWPEDQKAPLRPLVEWLLAERINAPQSDRARWQQKYLVDF